MSERFHTSVTERGTFRDCRRQWYLTVRERLVHKSQVAWPLIFGDCTHSALEEYYRKKRNLKKALAAFDTAWSRERDNLKVTYGPLFEMGIEDEWLDNQVMGHEMLTQYHLYDRTHPFFSMGDILDIAIEERAFVTILDENGRPFPGTPLLSGKIDLVVKKPSGIWIVDHKTASVMPNHRALEVDDQLTAYCYIYWRITGIYPRGAVYNVLVKSPPVPPRVLQNGTLSKDKSQRTTFEHYMAAIKELGLDPLDYEETLDHFAQRGWKQFFDRDAGIEKSPEEIDSFGRRLTVEYKEMVRALEDHDLLYPNPNSQRLCSMCSVLPICQAMEEQGDPEYVAENMYVTQEPRVIIPKGV